MLAPKHFYLCMSVFRDQAVRNGSSCSINLSMFYLSKLICFSRVAVSASKYRACSDDILHCT